LQALQNEYFTNNPAATLPRFLKLPLRTMRSRDRQPEPAVDVVDGALLASLSSDGDARRPRKTAHAAHLVPKQASSPAGSPTSSSSASRGRGVRRSAGTGASGEVSASSPVVPAPRGSHNFPLDQPDRLRRQVLQNRLSAGSSIPPLFAHGQIGGPEYDSYTESTAGSLNASAIDEPPLHTLNTSASSGM
jgi:hypothetical protein